MSVRSEQPSGVLIIPDAVDELLTDLGWQAECDQVRAALHRESLPSCRGPWCTEPDVGGLGVRGE